MRVIGFVLNPIAGMGGRVGLKGTDSAVEEARRRGAKPHSPERAHRALVSLRRHDDSVAILTWDDPMGRGAVEQVGFNPTVIGAPADTETSACDTRRAVKTFIQHDVDLILFVGGDGTAVDIAETLSTNESIIPILGVPAGVKIFSSVFAVTPEDAGRIAATFESVEAREVFDIDESAYRKGEVQSQLRAIARVPVSEGIQSGKQLTGGTIEGVVDGFIDDMKPDIVYLLGPGGTVGSIKNALGIDGTPLGIDVWRDGLLLVTDANEKDILAVLDHKSVIVVSPIGGQGFIFGRGNQQFTPAVIRQCGIEVVASRSKLDSIGTLRVDTGDPKLDDELRGWIKVRIGRFERRMMQIV